MSFLKIVKSDDKVLLAVTVTDEMVKDYKECERMASEGIEGKNCDKCSWKGTSIEDVCMCELIEL